MHRKERNQRSELEIENAWESDLLAQALSRRWKSYTGRAIYCTEFYDF